MLGKNQMQTDTPAGLSSPPDLASVRQRRCPRCQRQTKHIEIELEVRSWGRILALGAWAAFFPGKDRALVCEHYGHVFQRRQVESSTANRLIGWALLGFSLVVFVGVCVLVIRGMIGTK